MHAEYTGRISRFIALLILSTGFLTACAAKPIPPEFFVTEQALTKAPWGVTDFEKSAIALMDAVRAKKHLLVYLRKPGVKEDGYRQVYATALGKMGASAQGITVNVEDPTEKAFVDKYGLQKAPMPLVLVFAPNGVILGGFPAERITEEALLASLASPCLQKCLSAMQEKKVVLLCAQNATTSSNDGALKGVRAFCTDPKYSPSVKVVMLDPTDPAEQRFASLLQLDTTSKTATTLLLAPPGSVLGKFTGSINKKTLEGALTRASSGGGCCPGGAKPGAACPPAKK